MIVNDDDDDDVKRKRREKHIQNETWSSASTHTLCTQPAYSIASDIGAFIKII